MARRGAAAALLSLAACTFPAHAADIVRGGQLYAMHCANCHGPAGQGIFPGTPRMNRGERMMQSDLVLLDTLRRGRNAMPGYLGVMRDRDLLDVIAYLRTLQR
jgi:cytochrome c6